MDDSLAVAASGDGPSSEPWGAGAREITVLVVDDEPSNLTSIRKIFEREGMRVLTAESAKDALEIARCAPI